MEVSREEVREIFGLHSFRIGLVVALLHHQTIQVTGRWASLAFKVYD